jgi:hypothetical protein
VRAKRKQSDTLGNALGREGHLGKRECRGGSGKEEESRF